ncbi:MAG: c-type cytochrome [Silicimonas sp.]|nr:c-type cytochrome [Silicimonas sp.]
MRLFLALLLMGLPAAAQDFTTLKGHGGPIMGLSMGVDGRLASASFDNSVGLWDGARPQWIEGHEAAVVAVETGLAPAVLSGGDDFRVLFWQPGADAAVEVTRHQGKVADLALSPGGEVIASAGWDGAIRLSRQTGDGYTSTELTGHRSNVTDVGFAPDGTLYSASSDGTLRVWEGADLRPRILVKHGFGINEMVVTEGWIAYGAVDGGTRVVERATGRQIADFTLDRRPILALAHHPETQQIAVGDGHGYIMMIDTARWAITRDFRAARHGPVWALAFSPDGETIYAGGLDDAIYAWPVALLDAFEPGIDGERSFLRDAATMSNGERQFMRKCSICHALEAGPSRKAGPTLHGVFGRRAGQVAGYSYSDTLTGSEIVWDGDTINALFDEGPDHYIPGSKMPMQVIAGAGDRADLIAFLKQATAEE